MKDITDAKYSNTTIVCKDFEIKNLEEYHALYVQSDTLLLVDVHENLYSIVIYSILRCK